MASIHIDNETAQKSPVYVKPEETYHGPYSKGSPVKLQIATGGAGQSGLIGALADAFIKFQAEQTKCAPFSVAWLKSDTSASFNYLAQNSADVSITYHEKAEDIAIAQGIANRREYAWRDHFVFVALKLLEGPASDPRDLKKQLNDKTTIYDLFSHLFRTAVKTASGKCPARFLSRYDKSATNIKESAIWTTCGQTPWSYPYSTWYHIDGVFPFQALEIAAKLQEYTLTDRGTWLGVDKEIRDQLTILMEGKDDDKYPVLLNPARLLVGTYAPNRSMAEAFADWIVKIDGGQKVIKGFANKDGHILYTVAPGTK